MHMYWTAIPDSFSLAAGSDVASWTFVTSLDQDNRTAELHFQQGLTYVAAGTTEDLLRIHTDSWSEVWSMGSIEVDGDLNLYKANTIIDFLMKIKLLLFPDWERTNSLYDNKV